jgi:hypothetical protein
MNGFANINRFANTRSSIRKQHQTELTKYMCKQHNHNNNRTHPNSTTTMNADTIAILAVPTKGSEVFTVPTKGPSEPKKVILDIGSLTEEDLKTLKMQDPFLYYSIPSVRRAAVCGNKGIDGSSLQQQSSNRWVEVERRSCISFECHTDLLLENGTGQSSSASGRNRVDDDDDNDDDDASYATHEPMDVYFDSVFDQLLRRHKQ